MKARRFVTALAAVAVGAMTMALVVAPAGATAATPTVKLAPAVYKVGTTLYDQDYNDFEFGQAANQVFKWTVSGSSSPVCSQVIYDDHGDDGVYTTSVPPGSRSWQEQYIPDQYGSLLSVIVQFCNGVQVSSNAEYHDINVLGDSNTDAVSYFGTWSVSTCKCAVDGTTHYTSQKNASVSFRVSGSFGLVMSKAPNRGSAAVYVDGRKTATINTYSSTAISSTFVYSVILAGTATHTVSVVNLATAGHPRIDFDAMATHY